MTPGNTGLPGKWPGRNGSSPVTRYRAVSDSPGTHASTASTKQNSGPCGNRATSASEFESATNPHITFEYRRLPSRRKRCVHAPCTGRKTSDVTLRVLPESESLDLPPRPPFPSEVSSCPLLSCSRVREHRPP